MLLFPLWFKYIHIFEIYIQSPSIRIPEKEKRLLESKMPLTKEEFSPKINCHQWKKIKHGIFYKYISPYRTMDQSGSILKLAEFT